MSFISPNNCFNCDCTIVTPIGVCDPFIYSNNCYLTINLRGNYSDQKIPDRYRLVKLNDNGDVIEVINDLIINNSYGYVLYVPPPGTSGIFQLQFCCNLPANENCNWESASPITDGKKVTILSIDPDWAQSNIYIGNSVSVNTEAVTGNGSGLRLVFRITHQGSEILVANPGDGYKIGDILSIREDSHEGQEIGLLKIKLNAYSVEMINSSCPINALGYAKRISQPVIDSDGNLRFSVCENTSHSDKIKFVGGGITQLIFSGSDINGTSQYVCGISELWIDNQQVSLPPHSNPNADGYSITPSLTYFNDNGIPTTALRFICINNTFNWGFPIDFDGYIPSYQPLPGLDDTTCPDDEPFVERSLPLTVDGFNVKVKTTCGNVAERFIPTPCFLKTEYAVTELPSIPGKSRRRYVYGHCGDGEVFSDLLIRSSITGFNGGTDINRTNSNISFFAFKLVGSATGSFFYESRNRFFSDPLNDYFTAITRQDFNCEFDIYHVLHDSAFPCYNVSTVNRYPSIYFYTKSSTREYYINFAWDPVTRTHTREETFTYHNETGQAYINPRRNFLSNNCLSSKQIEWSSYIDDWPVRPRGLIIPRIDGLEGPPGDYSNMFCTRFIEDDGWRVSSGSYRFIENLMEYII